ncbi:MAG TPA: pyruvate kinase [bacterium]|nr:pyruvate kinase [bacterium]
MKRTTIIATIGPASEKADTIDKLIRAGVDVFRLNFSHGDHEKHEAMYNRIRRVASKRGRHIGIMMDLQGPKIRVGRMEGDAVRLVARREVTVVTRDVLGDETTIPTTYKHLPKDVKKGDRLLLDDGNLELKVLGSDGDRVGCRVVRGGILKSRKGINLPGVPVSAPSLTRKDIADLKFGLELGVDIVAISFVREPGDIETTRKYIRAAGSDVPIVAKIERPEAVRNMREIIDAADVIMVARGDLGVEMRPERVPEIQKQLIEMAYSRGKSVITATQMLESMITNGRPTRAEASDVANAVYDGTGAVMLSGETAVGQYPVEAVRMMSRIVTEAERRVLHHAMVEPSKYLVTTEGFSGAIAYTAARAAREINAKAIVAFTRSGVTARLVSKFRPACPIVGATLNSSVARRIALNWGVIPMVFKKIEKLENLVSVVDEKLLESKLVKKGDTVVISCGVPLNRKGSTNMLKIHRVGELD